MTRPTDPLDIELGGPTDRQVSPDLWGIFLEDINYSLDGGLNADLVQNGDFAYSPQDRPGWGPLTAWKTAGAVTMRSHAPVGPACVHARLDATGAPAGLTNEGFDNGMTLVQGDYLLRFAARRIHPLASSVEVSFASAAGRVPPVPVPLTAPTGQWDFYETTVTVEKPTAGATLRLALAEGVADLDAISLRPIDSASGRPRTFRRDLVETLRELRPSFVRFPGGCVAHGLGLDNIYHWKRTVGPRHERHHLTNLWGYHQSMAIGYFEYFELCETLGATPLPVVAAGVCCQNLRGGPRAIPADDMAGYVQDVLDLVEFANGTAETRWGSIRASLGHPEPFGLRYLGLGNEDTITSDFRDRFSRIHDALRERHPEITVIGTVGPNPFGRDFDAGWSFAKEEQLAIVDEHAYRTPRWLHQHTERYDSYDRSGPAVYMGEYAGRSSSLRSALGEAAWMIGMERNADVVRLASYAPLLAKVGATQWTPDLIYFTPTEVRPSASYHVQRLFSAHRGERVCAIKVDGARDQLTTLPETGTLRLRSPGSRVRWTELALGGHVLADVRTAADGRPQDVTTWHGSIDLSLQVTREDGAEGAVVTVGTGPDSAYSLSLGGWQNKSTTITRTDDGLTDEIDGPFPFAGLVTEVPMHVRLRLDRIERATRIRVWLDGEATHDTVDPDIPELLTVAGAVVRDNGETVLRIVNATDEQRDLRVTTPWQGPIVAAVESLHGPDPEEGAPFEAWPHRLLTETMRSDHVLTTTVLPWSFTVLTLGPDRLANPLTHTDPGALP